MNKVTQLEPYVTWEGLGQHLGGASKRWLEQRVREGMPSVLIAGRRCFHLSKAVPWLQDHGYIEEAA